jgi:hypothetical protein
MKQIQYIGAALLLLVSMAVFSQERGLVLSLHYSVALPTGSFKNDVIDKTSFNGFGAELMYHTDNNFSLGLETGSQEFYQKFPRQLYKSADGSDLSAVVSNSVQTVPVLIKGQYYFLPGKMIRPFVALGMGGNIISYHQYAGEFANIAQTKFGFAARPEAGIYIPFGRTSGAGFSISAGYHFIPFNYYGINNLNNVTAKAGISFPLN